MVPLTLPGQLTSVLNLDSEWETPLRQFAETTGLSVSLYDAQQRRVGPTVSTPMGHLLSTSSLWDEQGTGSALEREMVTACFSTGAPQGATFAECLRVEALPLQVAGRVHAALVYGWAFGRFPSSFNCAGLAQRIGLEPDLLWAVARCERPVSPERMSVYTGLLATLMASTIRQLEAVERLQELARMREAFLARVSHDLRTPLHTLSMRVFLLLESDLGDPDAARLSLLAMQGNLKQQERLIEDLIDAARTLTGKLQVTLRPCLLQPILQQVVSDIEPIAKEKNITVLIDNHALETAERVFLQADPERLQQVFLNLLTNAIKFTPESGRVEIELRVLSDAVEVDVSDSGSGMTSSDALLVFDAFHKTSDGNARGLGLGLTIAKQVVELHHGSIWVARTSPQQGTTFTVRLSTIQGEPPA